MGTEADDIPNPSLDELKALLFEGLNLVIEEAKSRNVLHPPYGRPTPTTIEDVEAKMAADSSDEEEEDDPNAPPSAEDDEGPEEEEVQFSYNYGYNPLVHLATFLKENNPRYKALQARAKAAAEAAARDAAVAEAARLKAESVALLALDKSLAGISLGPSCGNLTDSSVLLWFVGAFPGTVTCSVSTSPDFSASPQVQSVEVGEGADLPLNGSTTFSGLSPATDYYYRVTLEPSDETSPPAQNPPRYACGRFRTLPPSFLSPPQSSSTSEESAPSSPKRAPAIRVAVGSVGSGGFGSALQALEAKTGAEAGKVRTSALVLVGSVLPPSVGAAAEEMAAQPKEEQLRILRSAFDDLWKTEKTLSDLATHLPLYLAFDDSSKGSDELLVAEEEAFAAAAKAAASGRKKSSKSSSVGSTPSIKTLSEFFPIELHRKPTRHFYGKVALGPNATLYHLDTRRSRLGSTQAEWLSAELSSAPPSQWKVVCLRPAASYERLVVREVAEVVAASDAELAEQAKAATVLQAQARGRKERKSRMGFASALLPDFTTASGIAAAVRELGMRNVVFVSSETRRTAVVRRGGSDGPAYHEFTVVPLAPERPEAKLLDYQLDGTESGETIIDRGGEGFAYLTVMGDGRLKFDSVDQEGKVVQSATIEIDRGGEDGK